MNMREILFRAKRIDNGEWVEGFQFLMYWDGCEMWCIGVNPLSANDYSEIIGQNVDWFFIDPETLCQYTGKSDEDGNKIFEGDIVGFIDLYSTESGYSEHSCVGQVLWDEEECCFHVTDRLSAESWEVLNECKVIGNVFDDKELLEEV